MQDHYCTCNGLWEDRRHISFMVSRVLRFLFTFPAAPFCGVWFYSHFMVKVANVWWSEAGIFYLLMASKNKGKERRWLKETGEGILFTKFSKSYNVKPLLNAGNWLYLWHLVETFGSKAWNGYRKEATGDEG